MKRYRLSRPARTDLDDVWLYTAMEAAQETADRLIDTLTKSFPMLAAMPSAGRVRDEIESGVRSFPVGAYVIYYRPRPRSGILIARGIHGSRDQAAAW
jgi:toxin ParE1/3/4